MMPTATVFLFILLISVSETDSYSVSRYLLNYPTPADVSSFFTSVSSTLRDSLHNSPLSPINPVNLLHLASVIGLDGSALQPPKGPGGGGGVGGGGGIFNPGDYLNGGNGGQEGLLEKGLLALPLLSRNNTESDVTADSIVLINAEKKYASRKSGRNGHGGRGGLMGGKIVESKVESAIKRWWERNTAGSKGLLVYLFPAVCSQLAVLRTAVPFFLDRLSQYLQPIYIGLSFLLTQKSGAGIIQATLWTSVLIGEKSAGVGNIAA